MVTNDDISRILRDHEGRLERIESLLLKQKTTEPTTRTAKQEPKSLADHIILLRDEGFFSQPKMGEEIHAKLQGTYHCEFARVGVALLRLAKRRELRRTKKTVKDKTYQAYVW